MTFKFNSYYILINFYIASSKNTKKKFPRTPGSSPSWIEKKNTKILLFSNFHFNFWGDYKFSYIHKLPLFKQMLHINYSVLAASRCFWSSADRVLAVQTFDIVDYVLNPISHFKTRLLTFRQKFDLTFIVKSGKNLIFKSFF